MGITSKIIKIACPHIILIVAKIGIVSDGQYGERAYEQIRKRFPTELILLPFRSSPVEDDINLTIPPVICTSPISGTPISRWNSSKPVSRSCLG